MSTNRTYRDARGGFDALDDYLAAVVLASIPTGRQERPANSLIWATAAGSNEIVPSDGGFLVPQDFALELLSGIEEKSTLYRLCRRQPVTRGNVLKCPTFDNRSRATDRGPGGIQLTWGVQEADQIPTTLPAIRCVDVPLEKLAGSVTTTEELMADLPQFAQILKFAFTNAAAQMIDEGIVNGTGVGQPLGVLNNPGALITVEPEAGQAAGTIVATNVLKAWSRMYPPSQQRAIWIHHPTAIPQIYSMSRGAQTEEFVTFSDAPRLFGRPLITHESCRPLGERGDVIAIDPDAYLIGEKAADLQASMHLRYVQHENVWRWIWRVNGHPTHAYPIPPLYGTEATSPYVTLGARQ